MKKMVWVFIVSLALGFWGLCYAQEITDVSKVPRMNIDELKSRLSDPSLIILDVRSSHDWNDSTTMIQGAIREDPQQLNKWINKYPKNKSIALYCK